MITGVGVLNDAANSLVGSAWKSGHFACLDGGWMHCLIVVRRHTQPQSAAFSVCIQPLPEPAGHSIISRLSDPSADCGRAHLLAPLLEQTACCPCALGKTMELIGEGDCVTWSFVTMLCGPLANIYIRRKCVRAALVLSPSFCRSSFADSSGDVMPTCSVREKYQIQENVAVSVLCDLLNPFSAFTYLREVRLF
jgi:hypothetical protein